MVLDEVCVVLEVCVAWDAVPVFVGGEVDGALDFGKSADDNLSNDLYATKQVAGFILTGIAVCICIETAHIAIII